MAAVVASSADKPTKVGWKADTYFASTAGESRAGSTVTNRPCTRWPSAPSRSTACAILASVVGHSSGQLVYPKKSITTSAADRRIGIVRSVTPLVFVGERLCSLIEQLQNLPAYLYLVLVAESV